MASVTMVQRKVRLVAVPRRKAMTSAFSTRNWLLVELLSSLQLLPFTEQLRLQPFERFVHRLPQRQSDCDAWCVDLPSRVKAPPDCGSG